MVRYFAPAFAALALAAPAAARDDRATYYRAELATPAPAAKVIAGGVLWLCDGTVCTAAKGTGRPAVMCKRLAEAAAPVASFSAGGEELGADDLQRCNG